LTLNLNLSKREDQICQMVSTGMTNVQIGRALHLSPATVKSHMDNIFIKMSVTNRTELAAVYSVTMAAVKDTDVIAIVNQVREDLNRPFHHLGSIQHYRQEGATQALDIVLKRIRQEGIRRASAPPSSG